MSQIWLAAPGVWHKNTIQFNITLDIGMRWHEYRSSVYKMVGDRLAASEKEMRVIRRDAEKVKQEVGKMQAEVRRI